MALADLVQIQSGQVVSRTLAQNDHVSLTVFAFDKGRRSAPTSPPATPWSPSSAARAPSPWTASPTT